MSSFLKDLYYGNINPEDQFTPKFAAYQQMRQQHSKHYTEFVTKLEAFDPSLPEQLLTILDEQADAIPIETAEMFIYGFRMGAKMMLEILTDTSYDSSNE